MLAVVAPKVVIVAIPLVSLLLEISVIIPVTI